MAEEEKQQDSGSKDPLEEFGEKVKAQLAMGKLAFDYVVVPKVKEMAGKVKDIAEGKLNQMRDSFDPTRGLERSSREVRDWFMEKGLSAKDANEMVIRTVTSALKTKKPSNMAGKETKND